MLTVRRAVAEIGLPGWSRALKTPSSKLWVARQQRDPFVRDASSSGYRARSALKLVEMDDKVGVLRPGHRVVDLGAAPGSWSQVAAARVRSTAANPLVVGVDLLECEPLEGALLIQGDVLEDATLARILDGMGGSKADVLLSDMAPNATGHASIDHLQQLELCDMALSLCPTLLKEDTGALVIKVYMGSEEAAFVDAVRAAFRSVKRIKPAASRKESREFYLVAQGYRGAD